MNARVFTAVVVAAVVVLAAADPLVQVRKGATPLADAKPNTFRVDLAFRVVEEAGEDAGKRVVSVAESLPETVSLVSGELARKFTVDSVEVDAAPMDGWTSMEYVVCADKVKFTLKNLTYGVVIPPSRISVLASEEENAEVVVSDYSEPLALRAVFPMRKAPILFVFFFPPSPSPSSHPPSCRSCHSHTLPPFCAAPTAVPTSSTARRARMRSRWCSPCSWRCSL